MVHKGELVMADGSIKVVAIKTLNCKSCLYACTYNYEMIEYVTGFVKEILYVRIYIATTSVLLQIVQDEKVSRFLWIDW